MKREYDLGTYTYTACSLKPNFFIIPHLAFNTPRYMCLVYRHNHGLSRFLNPRNYISNSLLHHDTLLMAMFYAALYRMLETPLELLLVTVTITESPSTLGNLRVGTQLSPVGSQISSLSCQRQKHC